MRLLVTAHLTPMLLDTTSTRHDIRARGKSKTEPVAPSLVKTISQSGMYDIYDDKHPETGLVKGVHDQINKEEDKKRRNYVARVGQLMGS